MRDDFAVYILSHGRPEVKTVKTLLNCGYTGKYFVVIDDEDSKEEEYRKNFGDHIIQFSKKAMVGTFDLFDNFPERNTVNFARNMCPDFSRERGIKYFLELDDDYGGLTYRYVDEDGSLRSSQIRNIDKVFEAFVEFMETTPSACIAFAQAGEMQGGSKGNVWTSHVKRKSMNSFFFRVPDDPKDDIDFIGRLNDDTNTFTYGAIHGQLWWQFARCNVIQEMTQKASGGLTEAYLGYGTYLKSMYTVMLAPSSVRVGLLGTSYPRFHHSISWNNTAPKLLNEYWKK